MDYSKINTLKLDNNKQVINVLSKNSVSASKISKFQTAIEQLSSNQKKLEELYALLGKGNDSTEKAKNDRRNELLKKAIPVITIMQIFAYDKKKKDLQHRLEDLTSENLQNCPDIELIKVTRKLWMIANKYGGYSLAYIRKIKKSLNAEKSKALIKLEKEYGLIPNMIKNIEEANINIIESMLRHEDEIKEKEKIVRKIKKIDSQSDSLLKNKIDRFVLLCENENPEFYNGYQKVRKNYNNISTTESDQLGEITQEEYSKVEEVPTEHKVKSKQPKENDLLKKKAEV